jgi:hypothetical protein
MASLAHGQTPLATSVPAPATTPAKPRKAKQHDPFAAGRAPVVPAQYTGMTGAEADYQNLVTPPGPDRLFTLESEGELFVRLEQEWRDRGNKDRLPFPEEPVISTDRYLGRSWPQYTCLAEPNFVCYPRLLFEQPNYERYGWDLGVLDMPLSAGKFFLDVGLVPYHAFTDPFRTFECNAGYCLPGDPVPLLLYPPEPSLTGAVAETGAILGVLATFP